MTGLLCIPQPNPIYRKQCTLPSYQTKTGFSLQLQEFVTGRVFTISAGENGGRRCQFFDMEYIRISRSCIDDGIKWMNSRFKPVPKSRFSPPYTPKTSEEKAVMAAFKKLMVEKGFVDKVTSLEVDDDWACGVSVDIKKQTDGGEFVAHKEKGLWKIVAMGSMIDEDLYEKHVKVPARFKKKWWGR